MRNTGIPIIGDVPWGTHFCQFYQTQQDLIDILVPYFKAGLENNEFCMWVTSEPLGAAEAKAALSQQLDNAGDYIRRGQLEILDYSQWYTLGGKFESDRVLRGWVDKLDGALQRGWDGLRLTGNTFWLEKSGWQDFYEYEATVDGVIGRYRMLAICTYSLTKCGAAEIMDVVSNHEFALVKRAGKWQVIEQEKRKQVEAALRQEQEKLHQLNRTLRALSKADQAVLFAADEDAYLQEVCRIIVEDCGHAMVWVGYAEEDEAKSVRPVAYSGFEQGYLDTLNVTWADTERGRGPTGTAIRTGKACACPNMLTDPQFLPWREQALRRGYRSSIALPLIDGGKAFGALAIYSREPDPFSEDEVNLLTELAGDFSRGISVLRLRAAHQRAEDELRQQREWLRVTLSSIGDAVLATDTAGRITFLNPVAAALTGWTENEALGQPVQSVFRIVSEQTREDGEDIVGRVLREGCIVSLANSTALVTRAGREIPIEDSAAPITASDGSVSGVVLVFHDVTEKRRAQAALRESEQRVRLKLESILSPEGDIGSLELGDVIDAHAIQSFMEDFYRIARMPLAIIDLKGRVLVGVGWQDICTRFHRVHPEACRNCVESDTELSAGVAPGEFKLYKCKNQMWDVATPLMVGGRHVGNIFSGQFFFEDEPVDREMFRVQARKFDFNEAEYLAALEAVPRLSKARVDTGMDFLAKLGQTLSLLSYSNIKLARSLSERERAEEALRQASNQRGLALEAAELGAWDYHFVTGAVYWDERCRQMWDIPAGDEIDYQDAISRIHPDDRAATDAAVKAALSGAAGGSYHREFRVVWNDGSEHWISSHGRVYFEGEGDSRRAVRFVGVNMEFTERKREQEALQQAQKLESIGLLAGGIAHDFNNLLVGVVGNASLAENMLPHGNPAAEILECIVKAGEQAAHLTRQMLAYAGKGRFVVEPVNLSGLVRDTTPLIQSSVSKKIAFSFRLASGMPPVESDPSQMQQVFMNLALNAGEAIGDRTGVISVATGEVTLDSTPIDGQLGAWRIAPGRYAYLEVRDTGCGMHPGATAKIFDPFYTTKFQGRGLGLAAVAGIVRAHKGAIQVWTAPGEGATFRVLLPAMAAVPEGKAAPAQPEGDLRGKGIVLVVDDEPVVRDLAKRSLERQGYQVLVADNGPSAVEIVRTDGDGIRLVVLDLSMPGMSGEETLAEFRKLKPDLQVVVSSGYSQAEAMRLFHGARVSGFIQKPYTVQQLAKEVKLALK